MKIDSTVKVELNMPKILNKVENDTFGLFLAKEWAKLIDPFVPSSDKRLLRGSVTFPKPFLIKYNENYSRYMYYGEIYVDPVTGASGFLTKDGKWKSRYGVKKVPSGRRFNYSTDPNPQATDHWDQKAAQAGKKEQLVSAANNYLRRLG